MRELTQQELGRLNMAQLIDFGRQALDAQSYARAAALFREAVRRAPFRQDLKEMLAMAIDGDLQESPPTPRPMRATPPPPPPPPSRPHPGNWNEPSPRRQADPRPAEADRWDPRSAPPRERGDEAPRRFAEPREERCEERRPDRSEWAAQPNQAHQAESTGRFDGGRYGASLPGLDPEYPAPPPQSAPPPRLNVGGARFSTGQGRHVAPPRPAVGRPARHKPMDFGRRHQRGPMSAILTSIFVGLILIGAGSAGFWYYQGHAEAINDSLASLFTGATFNSTVERVTTYRQKQQYAQAIELLTGLPQNARRDALLADIYNEKGDQKTLEAKPPNYESAIEDYKNALKHDGKNSKYGNNLGWAYYQLSMEKREDAKASEQYLELAKQTLEAVRQIDPNNIRALDLLAKVAKDQNDDTLAYNCWRKILETAPESPEAQNARNSIRSRGYKLN